jgi:hypothetical protein
MGKFTKHPWLGGGAATGVFCSGYVDNKGVRLAPQVGFGSEDGIDSIGSYWFYCNASNGFGQKCLLCTTDLSHVTVFLEVFRMSSLDRAVDSSALHSKCFDQTAAARTRAWRNPLPAREGTISYALPSIR